MGGWSTRDERAGSEAFEFIRTGSGRKPGAAQAIFLPEIRRFSQISQKSIVLVQAKTGAGQDWPKNTRPGVRWVETPRRDFISAVWVEPLRHG